MIDSILFPKVGRKKYLLCVFLLAAVLHLLQGCDNDKEKTVVDFSKTVKVTHQGAINKNGKKVLHVAVAAMVSPKTTLIFYQKLLDYLSDKLGQSVVLVQRKTYKEIDQAIGNGNIDFAFICSGPYAVDKKKYGYELLATPLIHGRHFYYSYLIVNKDSPYKRLEDLRGKIFAFTDPDSNTGKLVPTYWLSQIHEKPETFFNKIIYTYSHDNSILAVARGLVDGAAVDSLVWEYYKSKKPELTRRTRIIKKSQPFGIPPIVASRATSPDLKKRVQKILISMHQDSEGKHILSELMIERFILPQDEWYDNIRKLKEKTL